MGSLAGIAIRSASREPMQLLEEVEVSLERGLEGDCRGATPGRQVTVLGRSGWQRACAELGAELLWTTRRANLLVDGVELRESAGARLRIGSLLLEITEECQPCLVMDRQRQGLRRALVPEWRAGVVCDVVEGGRIRIGDPVQLERRG